MTFDHFRFVDQREHPFVVLVDVHGGAEIIGENSMCKVTAANTLRVIADVMESGHGPGVCTPAGPAGFGRPDEPLYPHAGTLDQERQVWTDGAGHAWDLSVPWRDNAGSTWLWYGRLDLQGAPLMRSNDWPEPQPLDALRFLRGPMAPVYRGGAA
ncbi:phiSA1p31-related protein [Streptomyces sp. C1-2]|uniref:phiSA1p31-related protein n=1 Tax=Streptomyces sp. C1-2 TaxID=2720022 RepID=UPI00143260FF|nr:phiSA1p31-related protein [Streptomyces sp. C1-2]NJP71929.1 hypothetical protein [Streptomyces sp. C1-2]